jgi:class 3 adenylate cyclase
VPKSIAKRLCAGERAIADDLPAATILFADIHEFSEITAGLDADAVVGLLNGIFAAFEKLAESHGLILIKTSGDSCEFVAGAPDPRDFHAQAAAELALDMQEAITRFSTPCGRMPSLRIGIHSGPVFAGLIGTRRLVYDIWGDAVRIASHMEEYGLPGRIQVTAATRALLRDDYLLEERGEFYVAGTGGGFPARSGGTRGASPDAPDSRPWELHAHAEWSTACESSSTGRAASAVCTPRCSRSLARRSSSWPAGRVSPTSASTVSGWRTP